MSRNSLKIVLDGVFNVNDENIWRARIRGSGSVPICPGSATLLERAVKVRRIQNISCPVMQRYL
jgi:hypothetical protein